MNRKIEGYMMPPLSASLIKIKFIDYEESRNYASCSYFRYDR